MGIVIANIQVGNQDEVDMVDVDEVLVDTGALHSVLPAPLLEGIEVVPDGYDEVEYADGGRGVIPLGSVRIRIKGHDEVRVCPVYFSDSGQQLLGATTLEIFRLMVDPVEDGLVKKPPIRGRPF